MFFSLATPATASATPEFGTSTITSTPSRSNHCRAMRGADIGLVLVVGAEITSTLKPLAGGTEIVQRLAAARSTATGPPRSLYGPDRSVRHADLERRCLCSGAAGRTARRWQPAAADAEQRRGGSGASNVSLAAGVSRLVRSADASRARPRADVIRPQIFVQLVHAGVEFVRSGSCRRRGRAP